MDDSSKVVFISYYFIEQEYLDCSLCMLHLKKMFQHINVSVDINTIYPFLPKHNLIWSAAFHISEVKFSINIYWMHFSSPLGVSSFLYFRKSMLQIKRQRPGRLSDCLRAWELFHVGIRYWRNLYSFNLHNKWR